MVPKTNFNISQKEEIKSLKMWTHKHPTHRKTQRHNDVDEIEGLYYRLPLQMGNKNFASRPSDHRPTAEIKPSIDGRR